MADKRTSGSPSAGKRTAAKKTAARKNAPSRKTAAARAGDGPEREPFDPIAALDVADAVAELEAEVNGDQPDAAPGAPPAIAPVPAAQPPAEATSDPRETSTPPTLAFTWPPITYWMKATAGVLAVLALASAVVAIRQVLLLLLIAVILAIGLQPGITWLVSKGMRRGMAVTLIFSTAFVVVVGFLAMITPSIIGQIGGLVEDAPTYVERAEKKYTFVRDLNERFNLSNTCPEVPNPDPNVPKCEPGKLQSLANELPGTALAFIKSFTAFLFNAITVIILTLYFATALPRMEAAIARLLRRDNREEFQAILEDSTGLVGGYMLGNLIVSLIAGVVSFIALAVIGVPYAAALAFWVALADLVPTVGALLGAAAAVLVSIFAGIPQLVATSIFFLIYQQIENYVIAPRVMTRTVEMSAAAVIVAVLIGGTLAGFAGALLALPAAAIIKVTVTRLFLQSRLEAVRLADEADEVLHGPRRRLRLRRHRGSDDS